MSTPGPWDARADKSARTSSSSNSSTALLVHGARSSWLTYETFYGLEEQPFSLSSNPAFFYQSRSHASTFQELLAGIRRRERLSVLTGDIGTGKTTLCRAVLQNLDRKTFSAFVPDPFASREDLLKVLLMDFGVMSLSDLTSGRLRGASRTELSYLLYDFLGTLAPLQAFAVVIIDEAQNLSLPLLEEIRILSDSDGRDRQLQVVLVGQLELRQKLRLADMRQVDQRVSVRCHLEPLSRESVAGYVTHRLSVAGGAPDRVSFSPEALAAVYEASNGVPRLINRICDRALHQGVVSHVRLIDREIVQTAIRELGLGRPDGTATTIAVSAPAVTDVASEPPLDTIEFSERIDHWLTAADGDPTAASQPAPERSTRRQPAAKVVNHGGSISLPRVLDGHRGDRARVERQPLTHMEELTRRWLRTAGIAVTALLALGILVAGFASLGTLERQFVQPPALPALPAQPPRPAPLAFTPPASPPLVPPQGIGAGAGYIIEVALFETPQRAQNLAADLANAGYRAYAVELHLANLGIRQQVLIGPYATRTDAESDLERLHQIRGLEDARTVEKSAL
jgi:general secretion pathway protein A